MESSSNYDAASLPEGSGLFDFYVDQLETYLDGELDEDEARAVRERLAQEPAYAASLDRLSRARRTRIDAIGESCAVPEDDVAADRLRDVARRLSAPSGSTEAPATASRAWWRDPWALRTAIAAGIAAAFLLGLYGRYETGPSERPTADLEGNPVPSVNSGNVRTVSDEEDEDPEADASGR